MAERDTNRKKHRIPRSPRDREELLEQWIREYGDRVYRTALYFLKDPALAEDAGQETFLLAYQHMNQFRGDGSPLSWLLRIAANHARDILRTTYSRSVTQTADWDTAPLIGSRNAQEDPDGRMDLAAALAQLDARYRRPLLLHDYYGFRSAEIAVLLQITPAAARKRLERARRNMRALLGQDEDKGQVANDTE